MPLSLEKVSWRCSESAMVRENGKRCVHENSHVLDDILDSIDARVWHDASITDKDIA